MNPIALLITVVFAGIGQQREPGNPRRAKPPGHDKSRTVARLKAATLSR
jgi:hypothetical protein